MARVWEKFRDTPRNRVDGFVHEIAKASLAREANLLGFARETLPDLTEDEVSRLVNLNLDMLRPPQDDVGWSDWISCWEDGIYFGLRACGARAVVPLRERVALSRRDTARSVFFECLIAAMVAGNARRAEFEALAAAMEPLRYDELYETADVSTWVTSLIKFHQGWSEVPDGWAEPVLDLLERSWFSDEHLWDDHDREHSQHPWASAVLHIALNMPGLRSRYIDVLRRTADGSYFPVKINIHNANDNPPQGVARVLKIGCIQGAALVLLEEEPQHDDLIALCRTYADSPAEDTREA